MDISPSSYAPGFVKAVEKTILTHRMLQAGDAVLVGVSGGADSVALLDLISTLAPVFSLKLGVAHLNHGLRREESDRDADFVAGLARSRNISAYIKKVDTETYKQSKKLSLEEAGRHLRYDFFVKTARQNGFNKIALAHHANDNAELVLMFLLRGAGPLGLSGIPPVRKLAGQATHIIRPFIETAQSDIMAFVETRKLSYVTDKSNIDTRHMRNRIRHHLLPFLKHTYNPQIAAALNRLAAIMRAEEKWKDDMTDKLFQHAVLPSPAQGAALSISRIKALDEAPQRRIIRRALQIVKGDLRRVSFGHIQTVLGMLQGAPLVKSYDFPDGIHIRCRADEIFFADSKSASAQKHTYEYPVSKPESVLIKEINKCIKFSVISRSQIADLRQSGQDIGFLDMNALVFPLAIRNFRAGDRFKPLGMHGTQKLNKFFINQKVPRSERGDCPIVLCRGKIIWVAGHRIDESVKVSRTTQRVLKAELLPA